MNWLLWRQHRSQALAAGVALGLFATAVLVTGVQMAHVYDNAVRSCPSNGTCVTIGHLFSGYGAIVDTVHLTLVVPVLVGVFLGAILVARETEHATNVLVWSQSVTRRRWMAAKVAMALLATMALSATVAALVTWWSGTPNALYGNRFEGAQFDTQNVAPIAFALFGVSLGIATGCLFRRTLPALAATVVGYVAVRIAVSVYLRPHYMTSVSRSFPIGADATVPSGSWTLSSKIVDPAGHTVDGRLDIPQTCRSLADRGSLQSCLDRLGYRNVVTFHPAGRYWHFQWIEVGLYLTLAVVLVAFAVVHTLRHDA